MHRMNLFLLVFLPLYSFSKIIRYSYPGFLARLKGYSWTCWRWMVNPKVLCMRGVCNPITHRWTNRFLYFGDHWRVARTLTWTTLYSNLHRIASEYDRRMWSTSNWMLWAFVLWVRPVCNKMLPILIGIILGSDDINLGKIVLRGANYLIFRFRNLRCQRPWQDPWALRFCSWRGALAISYHNFSIIQVIIVLIGNVWDRSIPNQGWIPWIISNWIYLWSKWWIEIAHWSAIIIVRVFYKIRQRSLTVFRALIIFIALVLQ